MLLGNNQLHRSYQINVNGSVSSSKVYVKCHLLHFCIHKDFFQRDFSEKVEKAATGSWPHKWYRNYPNSSKWSLFTVTKWMLKYWQSISKDPYKVLFQKGWLKKQTIYKKNLFSLAGCLDSKWRQRHPMHLLSVTWDRRLDRQSHQEHFHLDRKSSCCHRCVIVRARYLFSLAFPISMSSQYAGLHIFAPQR